jgi:gamma-glutamyltranspeptidase/glutathione hydrolase
MIPFSARLRAFVVALTLASICCGSPLAQESRRGFYTPHAAGTFHPAFAENGMVVAQEKLAAQIGADILRQGGNAVDAAVATGFAMAVTYPRAGNIGGGGYMLIHLSGNDPAKRKIDTAIDYRETAPAATTRDIFLDDNGEADPQKSRDSALGIGVPGTVAGLALAHAKYGSGNFTLAQLLAPAIALARKGIPIEDDVADSLPRAQSRFARWPASAKIFLKPDGSTLGPGDTLVQHDLADTLGAIARNGPRAFYEGAIADKIAAGVRAAGGLMTSDDLKNYRPIEREPIRGSYRGHEFLAMPPSSSGGVVLTEIFNILEGFPDLATDDALR